MAKYKIKRNDRRPGGSGRKYTESRGAAMPSALKDLPLGMRMKGGVRSNPDDGGFVAIVHVWDNIACQGEPTEWRSPEVFRTEDEALHFYRTAIRPELERLMAQLAPGRVIRRKMGNGRT